MKTKYINFKHPYASAPDPTFIPEHLIRKHWSLQAIEMYHIFISLIFGFLIYGVFSDGEPVHSILPFLLMGVFISATYLSATDNYRFRAMVLLSHLTLLIIGCITVVASSFAIESFVFLAMVFAQGVLVIAVIFLPKINKDYYYWCKSIANKI